LLFLNKFWKISEYYSTSIETCTESDKIHGGINDPDLYLLGEDTKTFKPNRKALIIKYILFDYPTPSI